MPDNDFSQLEQLFIQIFNIDVLLRSGHVIIIIERSQAIRIIFISKMSAKLVGSIKTIPQKSVGKLYRPSTSQSRDRLVSNHQFSRQSRCTSNNFSSQKKRTNSVGKIYNPCRFDSSQFQKKNSSTKKGFHNIINYEEMQNKLSNYLMCTMRTNGRQKYNYLSEHYVDPKLEFQQYNKIKYYDSDIKSKKNFVQLSEQKIPHHNILRQEFTNKIESSFNNTYKQLKRPEIYVKETSQKKFQSNKENINWSGKQSRKKEAKIKKQNTTSIFTMNHQENKSQLSNKLMKIIDSYQLKNKQLNQEMEKLQKKSRKDSEPNMQPQVSLEKKKIEERLKSEEKVSQTTQQDTYSEDFLNEVFNKLKLYNLKSICMVTDCDSKLEQMWRSIHQQIILDENVRLVKSLIQQSNIEHVHSYINSARMKKIDIRTLKTHTEQYDPFLIQKIAEYFQTNKPNLQTKKTSKWLAETFIKYYEEAQHHWLKYLSQQKMDCFIRSMFIERQITGLRQLQGLNKDLNLRDFTRLLSTLFKANLRNRNIFQIHNKLKDTSYVGRFIELLEQKAGKGQDQKKFTTK